MLYAAANGQLDMMLHLHTVHGLALDSTDRRGNSPVLMAARYNHVALLRVLIDTYGGRLMRCLRAGERVRVCVCVRVCVLVCVGVCVCVCVGFELRACESV